MPAQWRAASASSVSLISTARRACMPAGSSVPLPQWDLVHRDASTRALVNNWTRMDATLDVFVANGITPSPLVLDNVPYAFVEQGNRFYGGFGPSLLVGALESFQDTLGFILENLTRPLNAL